MGNVTNVVSMPVRAFLDSDAPLIPGACRWYPYQFQCPSGHFLIQTGPGRVPDSTRHSFNARQGIS